MSQSPRGEQDKTGVARFRTQEARAALRALIRDGEWFGEIVEPGLTHAGLLILPPGTIE